MKPIRILTPQLDILAEIDNYESLQFIRRWHRPGEFEIHINRYKKKADKLQKGNLILLGKDLHKVGIIKHREISLDEKGKGSENWIIKGPTLSGITKQRIIVPPQGQEHDAISGPAETIMKHYVDVCIVNPVDEARKIDTLMIASDQGRGPNLNWQSRFKPLDSELEAISLASGVGWNVYIDLESMKWVFDIHIGRNLTAYQDENPPVIFSTDFDNIKSQVFIDSDLSLANFAYVGGQGEGVERTIVEVPTNSIPAGLQRFEAFIDARDIEGSEDLIIRGEQKLAEMSTGKLFEAQIISQGPFKYEKDWDLGDVVTVQNKDWGVTMDSRITEVREVYEAGKIMLEVTFGNNIPTLVDKIKKELEQIGAEVRK